MSKRQSIGIASLVLGVVALIAYGIYTTARIRTLERRLGNAEERLRKVESDRQPRVDPLGAYKAEVSPLTNGEFLFDGVRPHDPAPPWAPGRKRLNDLGGPVNRQPGQ